jgi:hypothetical protein
MTNEISVRDSEKLLKRFEVPHEIYLYIKQLEGYIKRPTQSKLLENYPERFKIVNREGDEMKIKNWAPDGSGYSISTENVLTCSRKLLDELYHSDQITEQRYQEILIERKAKEA